MSNSDNISRTWRILPIEKCLAPLEDGRLIHQGWSPQCEKEPSPSDEIWGALKTTAIQAGEFQPWHNKRLPAALEIRPHLEVKSGDLLLTCAGPRNRCGVACLVRATRPRLMISGKMYRFRANPSLLTPEYLECFLQSEAARNAIDKMKTGGSESGLNLTHERFRALQVPVPSLDEQRQIVAGIETQLTRLDAGVAALKRSQANLKRQRASVLHAACSGQLVRTEAELAKEHGDTFESAEILIGRVPHPPKPNRWNSRTKDVVSGHPSMSVGATGAPIPAGWAWTPLVNIARMESGHTPSRRHPEWWSGSIPWISITDARNRHGRAISETEEMTNEDGLNNSAARLLPAGTVCVSRTASVGYVVTMERPMATSQDFVNWTPTDAVSSEWLRIIFTADREALIRFGKGTVHKTIYFPEWLSLHIALPPLVEQRRIVAEVERHLSIIEDLEVLVATNLARANRLRQAVLHQAFSA